MKLCPIPCLMVTLSYIPFFMVEFHVWCLNHVKSRYWCPLGNSHISHVNGMGFKGQSSAKTIAVYPLNRCFLQISQPIHRFCQCFARNWHRRWPLMPSRALATHAAFLALRCSCWRTAAPPLVEGWKKGWKSGWWQDHYSTIRLTILLLER